MANSPETISQAKWQPPSKKETNSAKLDFTKKDDYLECGWATPHKYAKNIGIPGDEFMSLFYPKFTGLTAK